VQVKTGEGKSIILAVVSIILALHGFEIKCACYSKYLSQRDYQSFELMFTELGL
jgi:preprotein translocase subunit SecA